MTESWREKYERHIRSSRWKNMRRDFLRLRGGKCERCGSEHRLELHHKTYERLGHERISDIEVLCSVCHAEADRKREQDAIAASLQRQASAAIETYAEKKYGEGWQDQIDEESLRDEFDEWIERKGDSE